MKTGIHPEYKEVKLRCGCGAEHLLYSTRGDIQVEICSKCHPFYSGKQRVIDSAGRVDRFKRKYKLR